MIANVANEYL